MKTLTVTLSIFILLLLPFTAIAGTGSDLVKVIHINPDGSKTDITAENTEKGGSHSDKPVASKDIPTIQSINDRDVSIKAAQTAYQAALMGFSEGIVDKLYEGSVNVAKTDLENEADGSISYSISVNELKPYSHPIVLPMQLVSLCFLGLVTIITILGSMIEAGFQTHYPESYGDLKRSMSGEYTPYNPRRVHTACMWSVLRPLKGFLLFLLIIWIRNMLINSTTQTASGVLGAASDNIIIRGITGLAMFIGSFQTSIGEYGIYIFGALLFVTYIITDIVILLNAPEVAKKIELVFWGSFCICAFVDLINMICTSFGVITSQWLDSVIFITIGIIFGATVNAVLVAALILIAVLKVKKEIGV